MREEKTPIKDHLMPLDLSLPIPEDLKEESQVLLYALFGIAICSKIIPIIIEHAKELTNEL